MLDLTKTVGDSIQIATGVISTLEPQPQKMRNALAPEMLATEIADYLVRRGVPFREGHHISGQIVMLAEKEQVPMVRAFHFPGELWRLTKFQDKLSYEQIKSVDSRFEPDVKECLDYERAVELKSSKGGTSAGSVREQIDVLSKMLQD